jgi:cyclopropane-fatty-acyl-phospholipid synthase
VNHSFRPSFSQRKVLSFLKKNISTGTLTVRVNAEHSVAVGDGGSPKAAITLPTLSTLFKAAIYPDPGFGEAFMVGKIDAPDHELEDLLRLLKLNFTNNGNGSGVLTSLIEKIQSIRFFLIQHTTVKAAMRRVQHHYDIGNDLYTRFLDPEMQYSCAFWSEGITSLEDAQLNKMHLTTGRLEITQPDTRVVDIGCGWGGLSRYVQRTTGAQVDGITLSQEQYDWARAKRDTLPENDRQKLGYHLQDYRLFADAHAGEYDRVVSVGMFEHVGQHQFTTYFDKIAQLLKPGGQAVIHTILRPFRQLPRQRIVQKIPA